MTEEKKKPAQKVYEQPMQTILGRTLVGSIVWADLECGHAEPATGKDMYGALRCQTCNPVLRGLPLPGWDS